MCVDVVAIPEIDVTVTQTVRGANFFRHLWLLLAANMPLH